MNQKKTLEIMWVNVNVGEKGREKAFTEELKTFEPRRTLNFQLYSNFTQDEFAQQHHKNLRSYTNVWWQSNSINVLNIYIAKANMK